MSQDQQSSQEAVTTQAVTSWRDFLESFPPGKGAMVTDILADRQGWAGRFLNLPTIHLNCDDPICDGPRWYEAKPIACTWDEDFFLTFTCRNCGKRTKKFAVQISLLSEDENIGHVIKYGEVPSFGPPLGVRLQRLVQPDRELFLRGRRCELQGLGVGAFAYYRRVVEGNKNRFIDEIRKVAERLGSDDELARQLEAARVEIQFTKALGSIKAAIPPALLINGMNPLTLLHNALSRGVHDMTDDECLQLATSIRVVLTEFAERAAQAIKDDVELKNAVARLQQK
jgi:hypothetical protein